MTTQPHHIATVLDHPGAADGQRGNSATNALDGLHRNQAAGLRNRPPLRCGFSPLDEVLTGGFRGGDFVLVGGKPGKGKTVAALQWARNMAKGGCRALFVSFEHDASSLLLRLLTLELAEAAAEEGCTDQLRLETLRGRLQVLVSTSEPIAGVLGSDPLLHKAEERVRAYGEQLMLIESSRAGCDVHTLDRLVGSQPDQSCVLFVDYLQKLPSSSQAATDAERVTEAAEALKELALRRSIPVIAVVAADQAGLSARRTRLHHLRGSSALAYEADIVVMLNDKLSIVSSSHLAYDTTRIHQFRGRVVFSVEKNRAGLPDVDLEFRKDFANYRFEPAGAWVSERLWDEGSADD